MSFRIPRILELLPKKDDCCSCGHCTCEVYATELVAGRVTVEACPSITTEARRMLSQVLRMEEQAMSTIREIAASDANRWAVSLAMVPARVAGLLMVMFPLLAVLWLLSIWIAR